MQFAGTGKVAKGIKDIAREQEVPDGAGRVPKGAGAAKGNVAPSGGRPAMEV
jgi:hypothetical protein